MTNQDTTSVNEVSTRLIDETVVSK